ncbi:hypothetical protein ACFLXE_00320 [Chloroflexota bacterium]
MRTEQELIELIQRVKAAKNMGEVSLLDQQCVMTYELGEFAKMVHRSLIYHNLDGYQGMMKVALGDLITQVRVTCGILGYDFQEMILEGEEHMLEAFSEYLQGFVR